MKSTARFLVMLFLLVFGLWLGLALWLVFYQPPAPKLPAQTLVVLGAGIRRDGRPVLALEERLKTGIQLWKGQMPRPLILISGTKDEVWVMNQYLMRAGVPAGAVTSDEGGTNTAATVKRLQSLKGPLVFITQAYHLPRVHLYAWAYGLEEAGFAPTQRVSLPFGEIFPLALRESSAILAFPFQRIFLKDYR